MNDQNGYDVEDLQPGMSGSFSKTITEADIVMFAGVSGDTNAVHLSEEFAATTRFGGRIAHGLLTASVISAAGANRLPGPGTVYLDQHCASRHLSSPATRFMPRSPWCRWMQSGRGRGCPPSAASRASQSSKVRQP